MFKWFSRHKNDKQEEIKKEDINASNDELSPDDLARVIKAKFSTTSSIEILYGDTARYFFQQVGSNKKFIVSRNDRGSHCYEKILYNHYSILAFNATELYYAYLESNSLINQDSTTKKANTEHLIKLMSVDFRNYVHKTMGKTLTTVAMDYDEYSISYAEKETIRKNVHDTILKLFNDFITLFIAANPADSGKFSKYPSERLLEDAFNEYKESQVYLGIEKLKNEMEAGPEWRYKK